MGLRSSRHTPGVHDSFCLLAGKKIPPRIKNAATNGVVHRPYSCIQASIFAVEKFLVASEKTPLNPAMVFLFCIFSPLFQLIALHKTHVYHSSTAFK